MTGGLSTYWFRLRHVGGGITVLAILRALKDVLGTSWDYFTALEFLVERYSELRDEFVRILLALLPPAGFSALQKDLFVIVLCFSGILASSKLRSLRREDELTAAGARSARRLPLRKAASVWITYWATFLAISMCFVWQPLFANTNWYDGILIASSIGFVLTFVAVVAATIAAVVIMVRVNARGALFLVPLAILAAMLSIPVFELAADYQSAFRGEPFVLICIVTFSAVGVGLLVLVTTRLFRGPHGSSFSSARAGARRSWFLEAIVLTIADLAVALVYVAVIAVLFYEVWARVPQAQLG